MTDVFLNSVCDVLEYSQWQYTLKTHTVFGCEIYLFFLWGSVAKTGIWEEASPTAPGINPVPILP